MDLAGGASFERPLDPGVSRQLPLEADLKGAGSLGPLHAVDDAPAVIVTSEARRIRAVAFNRIFMRNLLGCRSLDGAPEGVAWVRSIFEIVLAVSTDHAPANKKKNLRPRGAHRAAVR